MEAEVKSGKAQVLELLDQLPDDVSGETILSELQFKLLILHGIAKAERGEGITSHEEAKQRLAKWSRGRLRTS